MNRITQFAFAGLFSAAATLAQAELIYGVTTDGLLGSFDSASAGTVTTIGPITGIVAGQTIRGIDFRPANGQLYAMSTLGTAAQLYTIDLGTGAATAIGGGITLTGNASVRVSLDFNPTVDRIRVVTGTGQNYRVNPDTGALVAQDTNIGGAPSISGIAYTNNVAGAAQTTLYAYNFTNDIVGTIGGINGAPSPNLGVFAAVGASGMVAFNAGMGFDISGATGVAYLSLDDAAGTDSTPEFFSVNLATGALTQIGDFGAVDMLDISVLPVTATAVPEPASWAIFALGLACVGWRQLQRKAVR